MLFFFFFFFFFLRYVFVPWCPPEKEELRSLLFLVLELASRQRMTVKRDNAGQSKECGSSCLYSLT